MPNPSYYALPRYPNGKTARVCRNCGHLIRWGTGVPRSGRIPPMNCPKCGHNMEVTTIYNYPPRI